jgi:hypothetical protein
VHLPLFGFRLGKRSDLNNQVKYYSLSQDDEDFYDPLVSPHALMPNGIRG